MEAQAKKEADKQASKNEKKNKRKRVIDEEEDSSSDKGIIVIIIIILVCIFIVQISFCGLLILSFPVNICSREIPFFALYLGLKMLFQNKFERRNTNLLKKHMK